MKKRKGFSIGNKIYHFVGMTVFLAAVIVAVISYLISANRIDDYFKSLSLDTAKNNASLVDADYLSELKEVVESEEFQTLREKAEEDDNEALVEEFLKEKGLWNGYQKERQRLRDYLGNIQNVKYLYIIVWGGKEDLYDMYLIDADDVPLYQTGYYEERETELLGIDASEEVPPTISNGDWGWLCSSYAPVFSKDGTLICQVGCDVGMDDIMHERSMNFLYIIVASLLITGIIIVGIMFLIRRSLIGPLNLITKEMKKFSPSEDLDYESSGVIDLDIKSNDEIKDIYDEIRSMQVRIIDYLNDITAIQKEKEKAESDAKKKAKQIGQISKEAYRDSLTCVGSKIAYVKKSDEMKADIGTPGFKFAIVMVDVNFLKDVNDKYGHAAGDEYLKGCCKIVCQIYKHSPVYRVGGDEFVAILMGEDFENRNERLEEIRRSFADSYNKTDADPWLRYSAASGMSEYAKGDIDVEQVFKRADRAMYEDKVAFKKSIGLDPASRTF